MTRPLPVRARRWWLVSLLGLAGPAQAFQATLDDTQLRAAMNSGQRLLNPQSGYRFTPYVLREYTSGVRIDPQTPIVDAVTVGTPYERVRYSSYLIAFQRKPLRLQDQRTVADAHAGRLDILLFTHSPDSVQAELEAWQQTYVQHDAGPKVQRSYLDDFKPATLNVAGQTFLSSVHIDGPFQDAFSTRTVPEFHFLGTVTYEFDLTSLARDGVVSGVARLQFQDPTGRQYDERLDLDQYR